MNISDADPATPLISNYGIPTIAPDTRKPYQKKLAIYFLLSSILFERIAFYSIASDIDSTLQSNPKLNWTSQHSSTATYIFSGTSYISTLIFAIISDAKLGRGRTIIIGFLLYLIGYALVTVIARNNLFNLCSKQTTYSGRIIDETCGGWMLGTLVIIAVGAGAVKSNMAVFGAEQIQDSKPASKYFDKYVMAVNIGAMIEIWIIPYIQNKPDAHPHDYQTAYLIAVGTLCIAALLFLIGWPYYIHVNLNETVVYNCIPVVINAFQTWRKQKQIQHSIDQENAISSTSDLLNASDNLNEEEKPIRIEHQPSSFLDYAKAANHGKYSDRIVDDVKSLRGAMLVFSLLIPYWLIYNQINSTFPSQGQNMNGISDKKYIIAWMSLGDPIVVIIGILIFNMFVYKHLDERNRASIITAKLIIGMCCACVTMCIAGGVEILRQQKCHSDSHLPIYVALPQNIGLGFSQLFALIASCEYAYFAAPRSAQSLFMSLHFCSIGIASFIGAAYMAIFSLIASKFDYNYKNNNATFSFRCPPEGQKYWSFYTYFFGLAGLQLIVILVFILCQKKFRIIKLNPQQMEINQFHQY